jgi:hypothetical protein
MLLKHFGIWLISVLVLAVVGTGTTAVGWTVYKVATNPPMDPNLYCGYTYGTPQFNDGVSRYGTCVGQDAPIGYWELEQGRQDALAKGRKPFINYQ